jgi:hypothetical protein
MFTITWFAIKCSSSSSSSSSSNTKPDSTVTLAQKSLPTPITATTIITQFEIYELKHNCDYVVNLKSSNVNKPLVSSSVDSLTGSSIVPRQPAPQIASTQFKVPTCNAIKVFGRIRPTCLLQPATQPLKDTFTFGRNEEIVAPTKPSVRNTIYDLVSSTVLLSTKSAHLLLPRLYNIRYKIIDKSVEDGLYSIEFTWSVPMHYLTAANSASFEQFNGYQISVVCYLLLISFYSFRTHLNQKNLKFISNQTFSNMQISF